MSQARRRLRRIVALVAKGHVFVVTKNGKPLATIEAPEDSEHLDVKSGHSDGSKRHE
ncbi:type II toxin-antitoxin system Phd/YefM family antitoxin [Pseudomonas huaxiensis]|uniref:type II toxin-antitoxin system Phd/YefM family antitoxin n=1 Tax=Pseudomonas huaxiensis TaxID=2213017 RepID=UPI000DA6AD58|nr:type II toxin-antitoxin system prevent-host-death family antitoxin [Pseudomonas huaxiensis]